MSNFRWNQDGQIRAFWDYDNSKEVMVNTQSDRQILRNPLINKDEALFAVARVLTELMELAEQKEKREIESLNQQLEPK